MTPPQAVYHSLLRPVVLQILRATGYHSAKPAVIDSLTDLAVRYLEILCRETAAHAADNDSSLSPTIVDVRMALQDAYAIQPERNWEEQMFYGKEDTRGVEEFLAWIMGPRNKEIKRIASEGVEEEAPDYLTALKKKHSKAADDTKYAGTLLGKGNDHAVVVVEGNEDVDSIKSWMEKRRGPPRSITPEAESRPPSSGLSSIGTMGDEMDLS